MTNIVECWQAKEKYRKRVHEVSRKSLLHLVYCGSAFCSYASGK